MPKYIKSNIELMQERCSTEYQEIGTFNCLDDE